MSRRRRVTAAGLVVAVLLLVLGGATATVLLSRSASPSAALPAPRFVEETTTSGLALTYGGGTSFDTGGGVAVFDCDGDRLPDVYVAGGANPAALFRNESPTAGALRFSRVADAVTDLTDVTGAYPIDIDADGIVDLAVLRVGES